MLEMPPRRGSVWGVVPTLWRLVLCIIAVILVEGSTAGLKHWWWRFGGGEPLDGRVTPSAAAAPGADAAPGAASDDGLWEARAKRMGALADPRRVFVRAWSARFAIEARATERAA